MCALKFQAPLPLPNRADRSILPAILVVVLGALVAAQFMFVEPVDQPITPGRFVVPAVGQQDVSQSSADPIILGRAIFAPGRGAGVSASTEPLYGARFAGITKVRGFARAVLQAADGGAVSIPLGGRYRGWKLTRLNENYATFVKDGTRFDAPMSRGLANTDTDFQSVRDFQSSQDSEQ